MGANSFLYEMTPSYMGGNSDNDRVASPECVPIHLMEYGYTFIFCFLSAIFIKGNNFCVFLFAFLGNNINHFQISAYS